MLRTMALIQKVNVMVRPREHIPDRAENEGFGGKIWLSNRDESRFDEVRKRILGETVLNLAIRVNACMQTGRGVGWKWIGVFAASILFLLPGALIGSDRAAGPEGVIVVANERDPGSVELAKVYMRIRSIPEGNLIRLDCSTEETISGREFFETIFDPLRERLLAEGWIEGRRGRGEDQYSRDHYFVFGHEIDYLVLCKGVPLRMDAPPEWNLTEAPTGHLREANASVDSELATLAMTTSAIGGLIPNPLFGIQRPSGLDLEQVVRVFRLDGPSYDAARRLILNAYTAEEHGLVGQAFIDMGGPHAEGDRWLEEAGKLMEQGGYRVRWHREGPTMTLADGLQLPALYAGWYTTNASGAWADPAMRVPPGAIAYHIHSFSAQTLRSVNQFWVGPMVEKGVTATVGTVYEPLLQFVHRPQMLFGGLLAGMSWGEAAFFSLPVISWQNVMIGDPLYRPFGGERRRLR